MRAEFAQSTRHKAQGTRHYMECGLLVKRVCEKYELLDSKSH